MSILLTPSRRSSPRQRRGLAALMGAVVAVPLVTVALSTPAHASNDEFIESMDLDDSGNAVITQQDHRSIAPGVDLVSVSRVEDEGRLDMDILVADIGSGQVRADYMFPGVVSDAVPVSQMLEENGAIAAVNGSFFDINNSNAPYGIGISSTAGIVTVPDGAGDRPVVFTTDGRGTIAPVEYNGLAVFNDDVEIEISGVNTPTLQPGNVALFDSRWGDYTRARAAGAGAVEVAIDTETDTVVQVSEGAGTGAVPSGVVYLAARQGDVADVMRELRAGDTVEITQDVSSPAGEIASAIGANHLLMENGTVQSHTDQNLHPRTGIGFADDGNTLLLVTVDGRMQTSRGLSLTQFGTLFDQLGANDAVNLDGGGSSTMTVREPTVSTFSLEPSVPNTPSDGFERPVPNSIGLFVEAGSGTVDQCVIRTELDAPETARVFPGLRRTLVAHGVDEKGAYISGTEPEWSASGPVTIEPGTESTATVTGEEPGETQVSAASAGATGTVDITVLGELERLRASESAVQLPDQGSVHELTIYGFDERGFRAPIESDDLTIEGNEEGVFTFEPGEHSTYTVTSDAETTSARMTFTAAGVSVDVAFTVGFEEQMVLDFEEVDTWRTTGARSTSSADPAPDAGHDGNGAVALTYDFSQSTGTRTANARPEAGHPGYEVPGQPSEITLWVRGESSTGENAETYVGYSDADGAWKYIYGPAPQGDEWQQISYPLPEGTPYPVRIQMVSAYETSGAQSYTGTMWFDDLTAQVPPAVDLPSEDLVTDDVIAETGVTADAPLRVAVMSDAQFVGRNPDSGIVQAARETFREIVAAEPDLLIINGDLVDEAATEDFDLARRVLDEELDGVDFPWYYVPGNHEIAGAPIDNFAAEFGDTFGTFDIDGVRFITLDNSPSQFSHNVDQLHMLQSQLDDAATNPEIDAVVVAQHMPIDDPLPERASQMSNRLDAEDQRRWLQEFAENSGKPVALVGAHVGIFHAKTEDGIPMIINGNSGKNPTTSSFGSFTGWTMLGIEREAAQTSPWGRWIEAEVMTRVQEVEMGAETTDLVAGTTLALQPTILQDDTRVVPVAWPMSHTWTGSDGVWVGSPDDAPAHAVVALDPATNEVHALRAGEATVTLAVHNGTDSVSFTVAGITGETPTIQGTPQVAAAVTAQAGEWGPEGVALNYQWYADTLLIEGATDSSFTPGEDQVGRTLRVEVTGTHPDFPSLTLTSAPSAAVAPADVEPPSLDLSAAEVRAGEDLEITGRNFSALAELEIRLEPGNITIADVVADAEGAFSTTITIPESATVGLATIRIADPALMVEASAALTILAPADGDETPGGEEPPGGDQETPGEESPGDDQDSPGDDQDAPGGDQEGELPTTGSIGLVGMSGLALALLLGGLLVRRRFTVDRL
ncbi:phosphodiester glycosidase family protein [Ruania halotolerans]|uniref:phosphodiester glycosidase family protein n=1 Tax=Ruania halotolerans TaxID=2897773 RepID=UPI001E535E56|nr:phosphodiester glycosidase family protein [Ruania halotolerans]UFU07365.1 phosphodiester glycosidase family protein [Ruania halotolerans]